MEIQFRPLDEAAAREVFTWHYPPPYDVYDIDPAPGDFERTIEFLTAPENRYYRMDDPREGLVAFCCLGVDAQVPGGDYSKPALDIGLGVRPDLTGRGQGTRFVRATLDFARQAEPGERLRVTIAGFNRRARRVWEKEGFVQTAEFGRDRDAAPYVILEQAL